MATRDDCNPPTPGVTAAVILGTAAAGAGAGAIVGWAFDAAGPGAIVGALAGALAGGTVILTQSARAAACEAVETVHDGIDRAREETREAVRETAEDADRFLRRVSPYSPLLSVWYVATG